jgi:mono/diheme cytochrome c family protein
MKFIAGHLIRLGALLAVGAAHAADHSAVERGQVIYEHWCVPCHGPGRGHAGTMALTEKYQGKLPGELSERTDLTPQLVSYFLRNGVSIMPFFRKTEISPAEEWDLVAYLTRNTHRQGEQHGK